MRSGNTTLTAATATDVQAQPETGHRPAPSGTAGRNREFLLLVALFAGLRLGTALFLRSGGHVFQGDADVQFYRDIGELSLAGYYPYVQYWMEYPPLFPWLIVGIYRVSLLLPSWPDSLLWFQVVLSTLLAIVDVGNLILVHRLAKALHGGRVALQAAWMYALLFFPLYVLVSWFDTLPLFFLLLTVWLAVRGRAGAAAIAAGLGLMVKVIPILAAPAAFLGFRRLSQRVGYVVALALTVGAITAPFLWANPTMLAASVRFMLGRSSWETIWALLEGYYGTGRVPLLASRVDPHMATWVLHPSRLPWLWITGTFLILCLLLYSRPLDWHEPRIALPAVGLTLNLFLIFSKGYSPQFLIYPLAFLVILLPNAPGAATALLLTANSFVEWPYAFGFFGDNRLAWLVVVTRTALLCWVSVEYVEMLAGRPEGALSWVRAHLQWVVRGAAVIAIATGVVIVLGRYATPTRPDNAVAVASYLAAFDGPDQTAIASTRDAFYQVRPRVAIGTWVLGEGDQGQWPTSLGDRIAAAREGRSRVWLILDQAGSNAADQTTMLQSMDAWGSRATDMWFGRFHLLGYLPYAPLDDAQDVPRQEIFGGVLRLQGYALSAQSVSPGRGFSLTLDFKTLAPVGRDFKAFVHLVDARGQIVTQNDRLLAKAGASSAHWAVGESVREGYDLVVPSDTPCGQYALDVGLYDPTTGHRLTTTEGGHTVDNVILASLRVCKPES